MRAEQIQRLARDERVARQVGFWWGLAEGLFFFVVPDVNISLAALFSLRAGVVAWLASIAGSATAIVLIYLLTVVLQVDYLRLLEMIPGISGQLVLQVRDRLGGGGLPYTPFLVFGGVPLKLYAASAFSLGLSLGSVLVWTLFARIARIAPTLAVMTGVRLLFRHRIDAQPAFWSALLVLFWFGFYIWYFLHMTAPH